MQTEPSPTRVAAGIAYQSRFTFRKWHLAIPDSLYQRSLPGRMLDLDCTCRDTLAIPADHLVLREPQDPFLGYSVACVKACSRCAEQGTED
jgi:hypothetical protein